MEYHYATKEGALILKEYKKGLEVVSYEGEDIYLTIPGTVAGKEGTEGKAVISVGKKAMLSCKSLHWQLCLPPLPQPDTGCGSGFCGGAGRVCVSLL